VVISGILTTPTASLISLFSPKTPR
jgi:hypothetical protein